ncbi:MAG: MAPEG family protein [Gammaproteobacteria bacterium]|nr:MAPEG family protein [Gammaproteobacteria bacterium]
MSISLGDGKDEFMNRQIRVQANFLENLLPFSLMFLLAELNDISIIVLHLTGTAFLLSRLLHAFGLANKAGRSTGRYYRTLVTWISVILIIAVNLYNAIFILL